MVTTSKPYEKVESDALLLPLRDRSRLASRILESLEEGEEISSEWKEELRQRVAKREAGTSTPVPSDEVWKQVNQRFGTNF